MELKVNLQNSPARKLANNTDPNKVKIGPTTDATFFMRWKPNKVLKKWFCDFNPFSDYDVESNKGINGKNARKTDVCLAKYSYAVAKNISTLGQCYTGVKRTFVDAGLISKYDDMPRGDANIATEYFDKNPEKFKKLDVKESELKKLPAGKIIVYKKEGYPGHIAITNGNGQEMSDHTDNMEWIKSHGNGSTFSVYELTDGWEYNPDTKKLEFKK